MRIYMNCLALSVLLLSFGCYSEQRDTSAALESPGIKPNQSPSSEAAAIDQVTVNAENISRVSAPVPFAVPVGYPRHISLSEAETFLSKQTIYGQGCGGMTWDGQGCGMFINDYRGKLQTPWVSTPVSVSAMYAQTFDQVTRSLIANFLVELRLDVHAYYRDKPQQLQLVWKPDDESIE